MKNTAFALLLGLALPFALSAHTTGFFTEKVVGEYLFDIGYSSEFVAGDFVRLDLSLLKNDTREVVPFGDAWVRISQGEKLLFAGPIAYGEFGKPGFSFVFPEAGDYTLSIRFENSLKSLAESAIPIRVKPAPESAGTRPFLVPIGSLVLGLLAGFGAAQLFKKKHA